MNIGVYSPNWIGDAVMALKFIGWLRNQYADDKLIVIARDWVAAIFDNHPLINKVLPIPTKELAGVFNTIKFRIRPEIQYVEIIATSWLLHRN